MMEKVELGVKSYLINESFDDETEKCIRVPIYTDFESLNIFNIEEDIIKKFREKDFTGGYDIKSSNNNEKYLSFFYK
jgi:hypothetical protein